MHLNLVPNREEEDEDEQVAISITKLSSHSLCAAEADQQTKIASKLTSVNG